MFSKAVRFVPTPIRDTFIDEVGNALHFSADCLTNDQSFFVTLAMLLRDIPSPYDEVCVRVSSTYIGDESSNEEILRLWVTDESNDRCKLFVVLGVDPNGQETYLRVWGFEEKKDLSMYMSKTNDVKVFQKDNAHTTIVLVRSKKMSEQLCKWHLLQSIIPRLLPWVFENVEISDEKRKLLHSLTLKNPTEYINLATEFVRRVDFRKDITVRMLKDFKDRVQTRAIQNIHRQIQLKSRDMEEVYNNYKSIVLERQELVKREAMLKIEFGDERYDLLTDYFLTNKSVSLLSADTEALTFLVETYLEQFDPEVFNTLIENRKSTFYINGVDPEQIYLLMQNIFGENARLRLRVYAAFLLNINTCDIARWDASLSLKNARLPNPHIQRYGCLGDNRLYVVKCIGEGDYVSAVEQCVYSAGNINFGDAIVVQTLVEDIFVNYLNDAIIELPNGELCSPEDALVWIKENNTEEVL